MTPRNTMTLSRVMAEAAFRAFVLSGLTWAALVIFARHTGRS